MSNVSSGTSIFQHVTQYSAKICICAWNTGLEYSHITWLLAWVGVTFTVNHRQDITLFIFTETLKCSKKQKCLLSEYVSSFCITQYKIILHLSDFAFNSFITVVQKLGDFIEWCSWQLTIKYYSDISIFYFSSTHCNYSLYISENSETKISEILNPIKTGLKTIENHPLFTYLVFSWFDDQGWISQMFD